ncbi:MAG: gamma-glutamylcyclotransferase family protein [bacterium]
MYYFAYGSNMSVPRLLARVPSASVVTVAELSGHRLCFHKQGRDGSAKCDAYETKLADHKVVGIVFEICEKEKPGLDKCEGLGKGYEQKYVELTTTDGEHITAMTYYATRIDSELRPYHWYKAHVLAGAREHGLPAKYIEKYINIVSLPDPDSERHMTEIGIYFE